MNEVEALLEKYNNGTATKEEIILVESWYLYYKTPGGNLSHEQIDEEYKLGLTDLSKRIDKTPYRLWPRIAAAAILLIGLSMTFYFTEYKSKTTQQAALYDIAPGGNKAFLTLSNGEKISLTDAKDGHLAKQAGVEVIKTKNGQLVYNANSGVTSSDNAALAYNLIETPKGGQYQVNLPDGTKVWLNAGSSLKYPTLFNGFERKVELTGEAYFEVAHDRAHPFKVATDKEIVTVLGTHFNVNVYDDEPEIKTTLLEGSVKVDAGSRTSIIKPGQQAILNTNKLSVVDVDTDEAIAWKNGMFQFSDESLESIMRKVSRWYNVDIQYANNDVKDLPLTGIITHFSNVSKVLRMLELTKQVHFKIEGRKIIVQKYDSP